MASSAPFMPFLRPLALPRSATVRRFLRFSTATTCREARASQTAAAALPLEDINLIASRTAPDSYPPKSVRSLPRPKISKASRRTSHPTKERPYPTRRPSHHQPALPKLIAEPITALDESESAPNLPYFVSRSSYDSLPIYTLRKRGGNLKLTRIKNIDGDKMFLKKELCRKLGFKEENVAVNAVTGHINIKGHVQKQVDVFLRQRRF